VAGPGASPGTGPPAPVHYWAPPYWGAGPTLEQLGMTDDEPISHSFVSRAIEKLQQ
jgi:hypothetical protein